MNFWGQPNSSIRSIVSGGLVGVVVVCIGVLIAYQRYEVQVKQNQVELSGVLEVIEQNIEQAVNESYSAALLLALTVQDNGEVINFERVAKNLVDNEELVDVVQLVPDGIIEYVYPMQGNESVIGYNILADAEVNREVMLAAKTRSIYFAGPFNLKQGGVAVVGRLPVIIGDELWGFSAVIIHLETLIKQSGIHNFSSRYYFQLSKINPNTGEEEFFLPVEENQDVQTSANINFPEGDWVLYAATRGRDQDLYNFFIISGLSFLAAILFGYLFYGMLNKPRELEALLDAKSKELLESREKFKKSSELLLLVLDSPSNMLFLSIDKQYRYLAFNKNHEAIILSHGIKKHIKKGDLILDGLPKIYREFFKEKFDRTIAGESFEYVVEYPNAKGEIRFWQCWFSPIIDKGEVKGVSVFSSDITGRLAIEKELRKSESRYRTLVANSPFCIHEFNLTGELISVNNAGVKMFNMPNEQAFLGMSFPQIIGEEQSIGVLELFDNAKKGEASEFEFEVEAREFLSSFIPIKNEIGAVDRIMGITQDITERKRANELIQDSLHEKTTLLSEIHHRVKNNLAIVSGLLELQKSEVNDERLSTYFDQSINRIISIAMVHELMYKTHDLSSVSVQRYLEMLIPAISATMQYSNKNVQFVIDIEDYSLNINEAIPIGLMLNELITNSFKYAFSNHTGNRIGISVCEVEGEIKVIYQDNGCGFGTGVDFNEPRNLGLNLVHAQLQQLDAEFIAKTDGKFELRFSFKAKGKGSHSNIIP